MNILVSTRLIKHQPGLDTGSQLAEAFKELGHDVIIYGNVYETGEWRGQQELQNLKGKIDLYVEMETNDGQTKLGSIKNHYKVKDARHFYWDFDCSFQSQLNLTYAKQTNADHYLVANPLWLEKFKKWGKPASQLSYGFSPWQHKPLNTPKEHLVGFIGSVTLERQNLIDQLKKSNIDVDVKTGIYGDELVRETNKLYLMFHRNQLGAKGLIVGRIMETAGCGVPLLLHFEDMMDINMGGFQTGHCVMYDDDNLIDVLQAYQHLPNILLDKGKKLYQYALENHTYKHRAETIMNLLDKE